MNSSTDREEKRMLPETRKNMKFNVVSSSLKISDKRFNEFYSKPVSNPPFEITVKTDILILEYENESVYYGEVESKTMSRHGRGILIWANGSCYQGWWFNDQTHGTGVLYHADGDIYEGEWMYNKAHGRGVYQHFEGAMYNGEWADDKQHGKGKEVWNDGAVYEGDFIHGFKCGIGTFTWADGSSYRGSFLNNIHGKGEYTWNDKRHYFGDWVNNKMNSPCPHILLFTQSPK